MKKKKQKKNKIVFLQYFVVSKPFKVIYTYFLLKKQKLRNSVF